MGPSRARPEVTRYADWVKYLPKNTHFLTRFFLFFCWLQQILSASQTSVVKEFPKSRPKESFEK